MNVGRTTGSPIEVQDDLAAEGSQAASTAGARAGASADWLEKFRATSAKRSAFTTGEQITVMGPIGVEFGATIKYEDMRIGPRVTAPRFTIKTEGGIPHSVSAERPMTKAEMKAVLKGLETQLSSPSLGRRLDRAALGEMVEKLAAAAGHVHPQPIDAAWAALTTRGHAPLVAHPKAADVARFKDFLAQREREKTLGALRKDMLARDAREDWYASEPPLAELVAKYGTPSQKAAYKK